MKVVLVQATVTPIFAVQDDEGRAVRTFGPEERQWTVYYGDLAGLAARIAAYEAEGTALLGSEAVRGADRQRQDPPLTVSTPPASTHRRDDKPGPDGAKP